jgi:hypothetical protein
MIHYRVKKCSEDYVDTSVLNNKDFFIYCRFEHLFIEY